MRGTEAHGRIRVLSRYCTFIARRYPPPIAKSPENPLDKGFPLSGWSDLNTRPPALKQPGRDPLTR